MEKKKFNPLSKIYIGKDMYSRDVVIASNGEKYNKYFGKRSAFRTRVENQPTIDYLKKFSKEVTNPDEFPKWFVKLWNQYDDHEIWDTRMKNNSI